MAVGPLLNSTGKTFKPSGLKKSFLSATDNGKSERVGASIPIMTFVASAEKLCCKLEIDNKTKLARKINRELLFIEKFLCRQRSDRDRRLAWNLLKRPIHVKRRQERNPPECANANNEAIRHRFIDKSFTKELNENLRNGDPLI